MPTLSGNNGTGYTIARFTLGGAGPQQVSVEFCERGGRDPKEITLAYRVLSGPGVRPRGSIEGEVPPLQGTLDTMHRFRDGVLSRLA